MSLTLGRAPFVDNCCDAAARKQKDVERLEAENERLRTENKEMSKDVRKLIYWP